MRVFCVDEKHKLTAKGEVLVSVGEPDCVGNRYNPNMIEETPPLILCSTSRLARSLQLAHARSQIAAGVERWQPLNALTLKQWLDTVIQDALLCGEIATDQLPQRVLDATEERLLWERTIEASLAQEVLKDLFDTGGMASAAAEAHALMQGWGIQASTLLASDQLSAETRQFLHWREAFQNICNKENWLETVRYTDSQIAALAKGVGRLTVKYPKIHYAGFDRIDLQQQRLFDVLSAQGIRVERWQIAAIQRAEPMQIKLPDQEAECRAAVAWAAEQLQTNPEARLAIVVPELAALHERLENLLDDALHPAAIQASQAELPRCYDFSLGQALSAQPLVAMAMALLQLCGRRRRVTQEDFGHLLLNRYWSADMTEADARAQFDAQLRRKLPQTISLNRITSFAEHLATVPKLAANLHAAISLLDAQAKAALPSDWVAMLRQLLDALGWPGERSLSSHEFQAQQAFYEALDSLSRLDALLGQMSLANIVKHLTQSCREQIFQARTLGDPPLQILGLLEAPGQALDAVWVMGMNDHIWPPQPRPNPLLPANVQRNAGTPNADCQVQTEFAQAIHQRLIQSAPLLIFSWAEKEADRMLRISPLIANYPALTNEPAMALTLAEQCLPEQGFQPQMLDDHMAPLVTVGEHIPGGTGLLKAQAICPAWAYYQYRLGARKLETPVDGLDPSTRGNLVHMVLQKFWQGHDSAYLQAMDTEQRLVALEIAAVHALTEFNAERVQALPANFMLLEQQRLVYLVDAWLQLELTRPAPFSVEACEFQINLTIEGIQVRLFIDRIDALDDDSLVIIDYKTGARPDFKNWAEARIIEPQLPIYAALALTDHKVAAVCFARVKSEDHAFSGIANNADLLPKVYDINGSRKIFTEEAFPDWPAVLEHWRKSINAIAQEIKAGVAANRFADEADLKYCEVLPLLRLPERLLQMENSANS